MSQPFDITKEMDAISTTERSSSETRSSRLGLVVAGAIGLSGLAISLVATPFVLPALRKYCLPYVPATESQLKNLSIAIGKHAKSGGTFLDVGSGDGRICRLASKQSLHFEQIHGVELNSMLVIFSRLSALGSRSPRLRYFHKDLWKFPLSKYDTICIFGVESMMQQLEKKILVETSKSQTVIACRFPFSNLKRIDEIGSGIDTVWVYSVKPKK